MTVIYREGACQLFLGFRYWPPGEVLYELVDEGHVEVI